MSKFQVHDERNCPYPNEEELKGVPPEVAQVVKNSNAIPYFRESRFRERAIELIYDLMIK